MIDWTKPVETTCGKPVRVLCTDREGYSLPIVLLVSNSHLVCCSENGKETPYGLRNVPVRTSKNIPLFQKGHGQPCPLKNMDEENVKDVCIGRSWNSGSTNYGGYLGHLEFIYENDKVVKVNWHDASEKETNHD